MNKKQFDRLKTCFHDYVNTFYGDDKYVNANLKLKQDHTTRVCDETAWLCDQLNLSQSDKFIALTVALFHDVGRFEQFIKYRTYVDPRSTNHCLLALEVLRENKTLDILDPREKTIIETAVKLHGTKKLPDDLDGSIDLFAKIIRDADKIDIYYVVIDAYKKYLENPEDFDLEIEYPMSSGYTQKVIEDILNCRCVDYSQIKNLNDFRLMQLGWVYDINFTQTLIRIKQRRFIQEIINTLPKDDLTAKIEKYILDYIDTEIAQHESTQSQ